MLLLVSTLLLSRNYKYFVLNDSLSLQILPVWNLKKQAENIVWDLGQIKKLH